MATRVEDLLEAARRLSLREQIDLIRALSASLPEHDRVQDSRSAESDQSAIPRSVKRTKPAHNLDDYQADFWPDDESVDELNQFVQQQRAADRLSDQ